MYVDKGETTTQVLLGVPVVFSLLLMAIQGAVFFHTANIASVAAAQSAAAGAAVDGGVLRALDQAAQTIAELSGQSFSLPEAVITSDEVVATVRLRVPQVAPFFAFTVTRVAHEPIERYISEIDR
jgi:hypothetical protein